ncbi:ATP-grasp domain-containing protein [Halomonas nitroreducens]|uniref:ATP-grasp domain-containing protein n=1 Tax=Halomonas nitroreducens TaxID=447425 RepID=A0A3S0HTU0_9GAMM|nr:ATP-grasp domain-containing protein [Halomonas nitroreducens]RTR05355.1 ATP-grasp domain-containing protein [Halomonas nitroreducens]
MTNQLVVSVGAGCAQRKFIEKLKAHEYKVAAFGRGRNDPYAVSLCDYFEEIDTSNGAEAVSWIKSLGERVLGAGSFSGGGAIDTLQYIDRAFSLCTQIPGNLSVGIDKKEQQKLYKKIKAGHIETFYGDEFKDLTVKVKKDKMYIVKPVVGRGSLGVYTLSGKEVLEKINEQGLPGCVVQEYVEGKEYRVLLLVHNRTIKTLCPIRRESAAGSCLLGRLSFDMTAEALLNHYFKSLLSKMNVENSIVKADVLVHEGTVKLIEMDIGVGGGVYFVKYASEVQGFDIVDDYIGLITGGEVRNHMGLRKRGELVMDYVYHDYGDNVLLQDSLIKKMSDMLGGCSIQFNPLLKNKVGGRPQKNSDFIFCVIHNNRHLSNSDVNRLARLAVRETDIKVG